MVSFSMNHKCSDMLKALSLSTNLSRIKKVNQSNEHNLNSNQESDEPETDPLDILFCNSKGI